MPQRWGRAKREAQGRRLAEGRARQGLCGDAGGPPTGHAERGVAKEGAGTNGRGGAWKGGVNRGGGRGKRGLFVPRIPRYTSIVYVLFGFFFIIFYIVIAIFTLKNKMKDKMKNRRNRSLKLSSGETVKAAWTVRSMRLGKDSRTASNVT